MNPPGVAKIHIMLNKCAQNGEHNHLTGILHQIKFPGFGANRNHVRIAGNIAPMQTFLDSLPLAKEKMLQYSNNIPNQKEV